MTETDHRRDLTAIGQLAEVATQALDDERTDAFNRAVVELHTHAAAVLHRTSAGALEQARIDTALAPGRRQRAEAEAKGLRHHPSCPRRLDPDARTSACICARDEQGSALLSAVVVLACWAGLVLFALALVAGWLDWWPTHAR